MIPDSGGGGDSAVDENDGDFEFACFTIEDCYGDLLGIEAVCHAIINSWAANELGHQPQLGLKWSGIGDVVDYTVPTTNPYHVQFRLPTGGQDGPVVSALNTIFHSAKGGAAGTADYFQAVMAGIYGTDPHWLGWAADQQRLQALTHLHGQMMDDFASIGPLMDDHFKGSTAEAFRSWYNKVDDVVNELVDYAGVAQLAAAGTANTLSVAKQAMAKAGTTAAKAFQDSVDAWRGDPISFPFPPGTAQKSWEEFTGLVDKVEEYASLVPGPIGEAADAAQTTQKVVGAASHLFGLGASTDVKSAARAADLYNAFSNTLDQQYRDATSALQRLGAKTTPKKNEVLSRPQLVLPTDKPDLRYT